MTINPNVKAYTVLIKRRLARILKRTTAILQRYQSLETLADGIESARNPPHESGNPCSNPSSREGSNG